MIPETIPSPYHNDVHNLNLPNCPFCGKHLIFKSHDSLAGFACQNPKISKYEKNHSYYLEYSREKSVWTRRFIAVENDHFRLTYFWGEEHSTLIPLIDSKYGNVQPRAKQLNYQKSVTLPKADWTWDNPQELLTEMKIVLAFDNE